MRVPFTFKELFFQEVEKSPSGIVNCHAHLDRAITLTPDIWEQSQALMEEKWILMRDIKRAYMDDPESFKKRLRIVLDDQIEQGVVACRTHVDADSIVELKVVKMMAELREEYKDKFTLQLVAHPLEGFTNDETLEHDPTKIKIFEEACDICDVVGGLPSRDRKMEEGDLKHMDILFGIAKNLGKDLDVHIDQENNPLEKDTEKLIAKTREHGYEGHVTFVHSISLACQSTEDRKRIIADLKDIGANVTVCPRAAIGMKQHIDKTAPVHNSIAPVVELLEAGVNVGLGTDNIADIFIPNTCGDIFDEVNLLADGVRLYNLKTLAEIATVNGQKTLKI